MFPGDLFALFIFIHCAVVVICANNPEKFEIPEVKLEALYPAGLRVSIPHKEKIVEFTFHGKINRPLTGWNTGDWAADIYKMVNGRWTYFNNISKLNIGDKIYYWAYIQIDHGTYKSAVKKEDGEWLVKEFVNLDGTPHVNVNETSSTPSVTTPRSTTETIPYVTTTTSIIECQSSLTKASTSRRICGGQLIFDSVFDENDEKWTPEVKIAGEPDYPFVVYMNEKENLFYKNGNLHIKPTLFENRYGANSVYSSLDLGDSCTEKTGSVACKMTAEGPNILPPVISARVHTRNSFSFVYGRIEVEAKLPRGDWIYPEILLEPKEQVYGTKNYASGAMKIAFSSGNSFSSKLLEGGVILSDKESFRNYGIQKIIGIRDWNQDFHNYTLLWEPEKITMYVDEVQYGVISPPSEGFQAVASNFQPAASQWSRGSILAPFDEFFHISLGLSVGGIHEFVDGPEKPWKNKASKGVLQFWNARNRWYPTWHHNDDDNSCALRIKSVKVYAL